MLYFRSKTPYKARPISSRSARLATSLALICYPPGAYLLGAGINLPAKIAGALLLLIALFSACYLVNTSVQRIVGEQPRFLDEFEMQLRLRAMESAYATITIIALLALIYFAIASETRLWVPRTYDGYNGLFWGAFLYSWILPTAFVAWRIEEPEEAAE